MKTPRCCWCKKLCPTPWKTVQNTKAMYQSARRPTYWHEGCWENAERLNEELRQAELAEYAEGLALSRARRS